jgi:uncharacterized protein (TIGR02271 family)
MKQTVVGVFDRYESAQHAANLLQDSGFGPEAVHVTESSPGEAGATTVRESTGIMHSIRNFFADLFGSENDEHISEYAEAVRRGGAVVKVDVDEEPKVDTARQVLQEAGAVNIDERVAEWREQGWSSGEIASQTDTGAVAPLAATAKRTGKTATGQEEVIPVVKEELEVGKRDVSTGGVRVYAKTVERPAEESLELREERAQVERRPVDRPASEADLQALKDRTVEVREMAEKPVVTKTARVVEEVVVGKQVQQRSETVRDTVRSTEVRVDNLAGETDAAGVRAGRAFDDDADYFRSDWQTHFAPLGGTYEDYEPAYRYGHTLGSDSRYASRTWEEMESDVRSDWERRYPGTSWERFKAAVRRGWERVTG